MFVDGIRCLMAKRDNMRASELARRLGESPQNFNKRLQRGSIKDKDLLQIAKVTDCKFRYSFVDAKTGKAIYTETLE